MKLSRFLLYVLMTSWLNLAFASTTTNSTEYKPKVGQEGKDVIWVPTPEGLIDKMLEAAKVSDKDTLFDLGAGDGIIAITATRKYGAKSVGIEYNPEMAQFARRKVAEAGLTDKVKIITGRHLPRRLQFCNGSHPLPDAAPQHQAASHFAQDEAWYPCGLKHLQHG